MQNAFTRWIESIINNNNEGSSSQYKKIFFELCGYKCNTDSIFKLHEDMENLEKLAINYKNDAHNEQTKSDFFYNLSVFIHKYKLNIRI